LCLGGPWLATASAAALATFTGLHSLELCNAPYLRANGLQQLTALRQLRRLEVLGVGCDRQVSFAIESTVHIRCRAECQLRGSCCQGAAEFGCHRSLHAQLSVLSDIAVLQTALLMPLAAEQHVYCLDVLDLIHFLSACLLLPQQSSWSV
jgi:hypothetical protein